MPKDASLDRSETITGEDGTASAMLTAPSSSTLFTLRASMGNTAMAELTVGVSDNGFTTLQVRPKYSGARSVDLWVASVRQGARCADLSATAPSDGALIGRAPFGQLPRIEDIPVGVELALTVRAGYFAYGCLSLEPLEPDHLNTAELAVSDLPLQVAGTTLEMTLGIETPLSDLSPALRQGVDDALAELRDGARDDVEALLNAMHTALGATADMAAFDTARSSGERHWDDALRQSLGSSAATALRAPVEAWMKQGSADWIVAEALTGVLRVSSDAQGTLELARVAGIDAVEAGFSRSNPVSVTAKPGDTILLGASQGKTADLRWQWWPSRLLTALARRPAIRAVPGANTMGEALAAKLSCARVATTLVTNGVASGLAFDDCDSECAEALCQSALAAIWQRAQNASSRRGTRALMSVSASSAALVDARARPVQLSGSWLGSLITESADAAVGGAVHASATTVD
jgi:hypothetical protein